MHLSAVSYLNTRPLVWGFLHGPQAGEHRLDFDLPAVCAERLGSGQVDAGLVPVIEAARQHLTPVGSLGIACRGPVRSILLLSKVPVREIRSLALDHSSRSSVMLTRIILAEQYRIWPETRTLAPDLPAMLGCADAALIIGDPALRIDPAATGLHVVDLGEEWYRLTGLPMVFAIWAAHDHNDRLAESLERSFEFGRGHLDDIVAAEAAGRRIAPELARHYLNSIIHYELSAEHKRGMKLYIDHAIKLEQMQPV
ncbi:MAG: menaquinone biosynthetic enzyme MqnA/MqnD family protein [Acidobacteriota bacterium]|jgi:predicted solute-binding protein